MAQQKDEADRLVDIKRVAALLGVHPSTVKRMEAAGDLPPRVVLPGRRKRLWRLSDIERMVDSL